MSTSTVASLNKRNTKPVPAKWDEERTKYFLEAIECEMVSGNRPAGILSRLGWSNLLQKFNSKFGLNFNKDQLKNKQDNLRRDFNKWETLIGKETGLGWDSVRMTLTAPDEWWAEKAKLDPQIMKYKESGPTHLDLLQKVFGGITATGYCAYIPELSPNPLLSPNDHLDHFETTEGDKDDSPSRRQFPTPNVTDNDQFYHSEATPTTSKLVSRNKKRRSSVGKTSQTDVLQTGMETVSQSICDGIEAIARIRPQEDGVMSYADALDLLERIPGITIPSSLYYKSVRVLEDRTRRIAFERIVKHGPDAIAAWLATFPDFF